MTLICLLFSVYYVILVARILLSFVLQMWRPPLYLTPALDALYAVTEPVLAPVRRLIPSIGGIDFSPILVFVALRLISGALGC